MLIFLVLLAVFFYVGGPLLVRFTQTMKARPTLESLSESGLPPVLADYVYSNAGALRDIGFMPEAFLALRDAVPNVQTYLIMLTNRAVGDKAMVTLMMTTVPGQTPQIGTRYVEFSTRFTSGKMVDTMNSAQIGAFKQLPSEIKTQLPGVSDVQELYAIHRYIIEHELRIGVDDAPIMYPSGTAEEYLASSVLEQGYEEQVKTGLLYRDTLQGEVVYRPTWLGAFYMTWGLLFPWKQVRQYQQRQRANAVLQAFRASGRTTANR